MNLNELFKLSFKSLVTNKVRAILTMLGVIIGVASVIILVSLVSGLGKTIRDELNSFGANLLIIFPGKAGGDRGPGGVVTNNMEFRFADLIQDRVPEVSQIVPMIQSLGNVKYANKEVTNTGIYGVTGNYFQALNIDIEKGRAFSKNEGSNVALIGSTVKTELFKNTDPLGKEVNIKGRRFKVIGVLKERGSIFGQDQDNTVMLPLGPARSLLGIDRPSSFLLKVDEKKDINSIKVKIEKILLKELDGDDNFTVSTQEDTLELVGNILGVLSVGLGGVAAISLLVGGVGIMNIMLVSVTERTREIGLRKALGAKRRDILFQFLTEAVILSITGGLAGVLIGILASLAINSFITTEINFFYVFLAFTFSAAIGIIFGIAPAIRASKLSPIEALRYE